MTAFNSPIDPDELRRRLEATLPTALDTLRQMVRINSFTLNAAGVDRVGDLTAALFEPLGFTADRPQAIACTTDPRPPMGHHLLLTRSGNSGRRIGLVGHLDTVYTAEEEQANDFSWRVAGERIYGPGTVDMKGGNVLIWMVLSAMRDLSPVLFDDITWIVLFNAAEEGLDSDFGHLQRRRLGDQALANLVFESGEFQDGIQYVISRRKGSAGLRAIAHGRSAHAGARHEYGANAIMQLCDFIQRVGGLTDYSRQLTCNVGVMHGGTVTNRVPDRAEALMELRAFDPDVLDEAVRTVLDLNGLSTIVSPIDGFAARMEIQCRKRLPAWPSNPGTERLIGIWQTAGNALGVKVAGRARGGLSDGNFTCDRIPTLDGLGPGGANLHCAVRSADGQVDQEYVLSNSFIPRAMLNVLGIEQLVRHPAT